MIAKASSLIPTIMHTYHDSVLGGISYPRGPFGMFKNLQEIDWRTGLGWHEIRS